MNDGVLPGSGKFTGCETGVDKIEENVTNYIKTHPENPGADTVKASG